MDLVLGEASRAAARSLRETAGLGGPYAVIAPFTTRPQKHWFEARWRELAARLQAELGLAVAMLGGPGDRAAAERIAAGGTIHDFAGRAPLAVSAALIREARLLVGVDTGLTHMGIALEVPTVALFGATRPYLDPATPRAKVLYHPLECSPCRRRPTCGGAFTCMTLHRVDEVLATARGLLETDR
jgi:heptosyltransferase-1